MDSDDNRLITAAKKAVEDAKKIPPVDYFDLMVQRGVITEDGRFAGVAGSSAYVDVHND